jgi:hypothetical protein
VKTDQELRSLFSMLKPRAQQYAVMLSAEDSEFIDSLFPGAVEFREGHQVERWNTRCAS